MTMTSNIHPPTIQPVLSRTPERDSGYSLTSLADGRSIPLYESHSQRALYSNGGVRCHFTDLQIVSEVTSVHLRSPHYFGRLYFYPTDVERIARAFGLSPVTGLKDTRVRKGAVCVCKCGMRNEYAEPNQKDGSYVCYVCRR